MRGLQAGRQGQEAKVFPLKRGAVFSVRERHETGSIEAMKELGHIYKTGRLGVPVNKQEAQRWNDRANEAEARR